MKRDYFAGLFVMMMVSMAYLPLIIGAYPEQLYEHRSFTIDADDGLSNYTGALSPGEPNFMENIGQVANEDIRFYILCGMTLVGFKRDGMVYDLHNGEGGGHMYEMKFIGARRTEPSGVGPAGHAVNYIRPEGEYHNIRGYSEVAYNDLWDAIDLSFYLMDGSLKYDFIIRPGGDPDDIKLECIGAIPGIMSGKLVIQTSLGPIMEDAPLSFDCKGNTVGSRWKIKEGCLGFEVEEYDASRTLTIDPKLLFSTYIGGSQWEYTTDIVIGPDGHPFICGYTNDVNFPTTTGAYDTTYGGTDGYDIFVCKLNRTGSSLLYSTFVGGNARADDQAFGLAVDSNGSAVVAGRSTSFDTNRFPTTTGAYSTTYTGNCDAILFKLNPAGSSLVFSTYIGGFQTDTAYDIVLDSNENPVIAGQTSYVPESGEKFFPVTNGAYDTTHNGGNDVFVSILDRTGSSLLYSTYIGTGASDMARAVTIDENDTIFITGFTEGSGYPRTVGMSHRGGEDIFVTALEKDLGDIAVSTLFGGSDNDRGYAIALDDNGNIYVTGRTSSTNFPRENGFDNSYGGYFYDGFLTVFDSSLVWRRSSYIGGNGHDVGTSVSIDAFGRAVVTGYTNANDLPTTSGAFQPKIADDYDVFLLRVSASGTSIDYLTYLGGSGPDEGPSYQGWSSKHALSDNGIVYLGGTTSSTDFPVTLGSFRTSNSGKDDAFVTKTYPGLYKPRNIQVEKGYMYFNITWTMPDVRLFRDFTLLNYTIYTGYNESTLTSYRRIGNVTWFNFTLQSYSDRTYFFGVSARWTELGESDISPISATITPKLTPVVSDPSSVSSFFTVNLSWDGLPDVVHEMFDVKYLIYRGDSVDSLLKYAEAGSGNWYMDRIPSMVQKRYYYAVTYEIAGIGEREPYSSVINNTPKVPPDITGRKIEPYPFMIRLTWDLYGEEVTDELDVSYLVYRSPHGGEMELMNETDQGSYDDPVHDLVQTRYDYMIRPLFHGFTQGVVSGRLSASQIVLESRPSDVSVDIDDEGAEITWKVPEGQISQEFPILYYEVYSSIDDEALEPLETNITGTTFFHGGLSRTERHQYGYSVRAVFDILGPGNLSDPVPATNHIIPGSPSKIRGSFGDGYVLLEWDPPLDDGGSPLLNYTIYRYSDPVGEPDYVEEVPVDRNSYNDTEVQMGITYEYLIQASNGVGTSSNHVMRSVTPVLSPYAPRDPSISYGDLWVLIEWREPGSDGGRSIEAYNIYRRYTGGSWMLKGSVLPDGLFFNDTEVLSGVGYEYRITARNEIGESMNSTTVSTVLLFRPGPPRDLSLTLEDGNVHVSWNEPLFDGGSDILGYDLYRNGEFLARIENGSLEYFDPLLEEGMRYNYTLTAFNEMGPSPMCLPAGIIIPIPVPQVTGLNHVIGDGVVTITWKLPERGEVRGFKIYRISGTDEPLLIGEVGPETDFFNDTGLELPGTYTYFVRVQGDDGTGIPASNVLVVVPDSFFEKEEEPEEDGGPSIVPWIVIAVLSVIIFCAALAGAVLIVRRRAVSGKDGAAEDMHEGEVPQAEGVGAAGPATVKIEEDPAQIAPVENKSRPVQESTTSVVDSEETFEDPFERADRMRALAKDSNLDVRFFEMQYNMAMNFRRSGNEAMGNVSIANYTTNIENLIRSKGLDMKRPPDQQSRGP